MHDVRARASVGGSAGWNDRLGRRGRSCPSLTLQAGLEHSQIIRLYQQREGTSETCKKTRSCHSSPRPLLAPLALLVSVSKPNTIPYVPLSASLTVSISQMIEQGKTAFRRPRRCGVSIFIFIPSRSARSNNKNNTRCYCQMIVPTLLRGSIDFGHFLGGGESGSRKFNVSCKLYCVFCSCVAFLFTLNKAKVYLFRMMRAIRSI